MTVADLFAAEVRRDGARPFLTWYDDATGERVELSVATLANWANKTANLLADECGLEPGDPVQLTPADHWMSYVVVLGAWTMGACVDLRASADDRVSLPGDPAAFTASVLPQPDALVTAEPVPPTTPALRTDAHTWAADALAAAAEHATVGHGVTQGVRVLSTLALDTATGMDASLLVPLVAGGSVVAVANADESRLADRARMERVTATAGCTVSGLHRLDLSR